MENGEKMVKFYIFLKKIGEMVKNGDLNLKIILHKYFICSLESRAHTSINDCLHKW